MTRNQKVAIALAAGFTVGFIATLITKQGGVIAVAGGVLAVICRIFMVRGQKKQQQEENTEN